MKLSSRVSRIAPSATLALDARAKELIAAGRDVVNMAVGEPDFPAPQRVRAAAVRKVESGHVRYTPAAGTAALRSTIARYLSATRCAEFGAEEIVVCHSAKHALSGVLAALVDEGDEVIVPLPAWVSYSELVKLYRGTPVEVPPIAGCRPDLAAIERAIRPNTRAILLNSPCNPSGYVWSDEEVRTLAELAVARDVWILSDEIYRRLTYDGPPAASPTSLSKPTSFAKEVRARTALIDGASKAFAMTGYRIGYLAAPRKLVDAVARLHSQMTGSPNDVSQAAFLAGLADGEPPEVAQMVAEFSARRRVLLAKLGEMGLDTPEPRGAFYAFPDVRPHLDARGSAGFCEDLLEEENVCLVPGSAFGLDGYVRLSYALSLDRIEEACRRLARFLRERGPA